MAKAIVKVNAFLDKRQTKDVYNLIYYQLKANLEVITVPSYCDVYLLNGKDIEVQKKEKGCSTCRYGYRREGYEPCFSCKHNDKWEAKENE